MLNFEKIGRRIANMRKAKGFTGEKMAEILCVSPQAICKWETGKCLPETSILPLLAKTLDCSIDSILIPKELQILSAAYGDGVVSFDVTRLLDGFVNNNKLNVVINRQVFGYDFESERLAILTIQYQTPSGVFFTYLCDNSILSLDVNSKEYITDGSLRIVGAFFGSQSNYSDVMNKIEHYSYFKQPDIHANHETFPSATCSDNTEYLTVIYTNMSGIHTVSCAEGEKLGFSNDRTKLHACISTSENCTLPGIMQLNWGKDMDCTWAGALYAALQYMGNDVSYEYIMGISAACFRIAFAPVWDFSSVDALVVYDYAQIAYNALGYELIWADRIDKEQRKAERQNIIRDIKAGKPPIAINLRIAPEWGIIAGYLDNGKEFLCRTYFDQAIFDAQGDKPEFTEKMKITNGYLTADCWPFAIAHFGAKLERPSEKQILLNSLQAKVESMAIPENRGYRIGYEAYKAWVEGLLNDSLFEDASTQDVERRLQVNDYQLLNLLDARSCAVKYLENSAVLLEGESAMLLTQMAELYGEISNKLAAFYNKLQQQQGISLGYMEKCLIQSKGASTSTLRREQAEILGAVLEMEYKTDEIAGNILKRETI
jgi:transcriptional regulator with XRE-family HTH domain